MEKKLSWKEAHGDAAYIPCGNAYCAEGNCAECETQMELQTERKRELGIRTEEMTVPEQLFSAGKEFRGAGLESP